MLYYLHLLYYIEYTILLYTYTTLYYVHYVTYYTLFTLPAIIYIYIFFLYFILTGNVHICINKCSIQKYWVLLSTYMPIIL